MDIFDRSENLEEAPPKLSLSGPMAESALLGMSRDRLILLKDRCIKRIQEVRQEMGWSIRPESYGGWMQKRYRYWQQYKDDWAWREKAAKEGEMEPVFQFCNFTLNDVKRGVQYGYSRDFDQIFSMEPWMEVEPRGEADDDVAARIQHRARYKFDQLNTKDECVMASLMRRIHGEAVIKIWHGQTVKRYESPEDVAVDENGVTVMAGGEPVTVHDWIPHPEEIERRADLPEEADEQLPPVLAVAKNDHRIGLMDGMLVEVGEMTEEGPEILSDLGSVRYERRMVKRRTVCDRGAHASLLELGSFGAPLKARDLQSADIVFHTYELSLTEVANRYHRDPVQLKTMMPQKNKGIFTAIYDKVKEIFISADDESANPAPEMDDEADSGSDLPVNSVRKATLADVCIHFDADEDGYDEDVFVTLLLDGPEAQGGVPLYWNYVGAMYENAERPFYPTRHVELPGVWYGEGDFETHEAKQNKIEYDYNLVCFRNSTSGSILLWKPGNLQDPPDELSPGSNKVLAVKDSQTNMDDVVKPQPIYEPTDDLVNQMEMMRQSLNLDMGVLSESQAQAVDLPSSDTATGVNANLQMAESLGQARIFVFERDLTRMLMGLVSLDFRYMDAVEDFEYTEGDVRKTGSLRADEVADLEMNVKLLLTRRHNQKVLQNYDAAAQIISAWKANVMQSLQMGIDPNALEGERKIYVDRLKALDVQDAEDRLLKVSDIQMPMPPEEAGALPPEQAVEEQLPPAV